MAKCYIALGANLQEPAAAITSALKVLSEHSDIHQLQYSALYHSKPMGPQDQPDYVNAVASFATSLEPLAILDLLQAIEHAHGRLRERRWGPRTLDLDILLIDNNIIDHPRLQVPHPGIELREFVLIPLAELAPELDLPNGRSVKLLAHAIPDNGLTILAPASSLPV
ncbi:2-amino-4-hydroxy-6-hydroxymethyldihydropteridine diphosphokinase [Aliidiomarina iranensis]|uniref:2-amino-4-hydroxy-6-hydroxymethyldihydropteridine pyrophosphokinase n=1 Tax=Aliidiomarina iranensis TaxID=1434071 RepID=A0A432VV12_9GAMM|nr:2-amino-4-hydroxy-6-hydroxymethyldihydropteridine diphosphokinase [Aliidiomarina iranensis]RUO20370.1 2-amino-4-hydroxy-6-hydroxymethyldihydropteridine diphosphokinase [Aliidiomarina iranensis]